MSVPYKEKINYLYVNKRADSNPPLQIEIALSPSTSSGFLAMTQILMKNVV